MNHIVITLSFVLLTLTYTSTAQNSYNTIDEQSQHIPAKFKSSKAIAQHLTQNLSSDREKARALYIWIAHNIHYDMQLAKSNPNYNDSEEMVTEALQRRKGVCQHYSELFHDMAQHAGLTTYVIEGYARNSLNRITNGSHAWNGIQLKSGLYFIDVTWASGYVLEGKYRHDFRDQYFLIAPEQFITDHIPFDPLWQFLSHPIQHKHFMANDYSQIDSVHTFHFRDTLAAWHIQEPLNRLQHETQRIEQCGTENQWVRQKIALNQHNISVHLYNQSVQNLNQGVALYNQYVGYKNQQFRGNSPNKANILSLLQKAKAKVKQAIKDSQSVKSSDRNLKSRLQSDQKNMQALLSKIAQETNFVKQNL